MDSACYASADQFIIGVRGSRLMRCSATTGAVIQTLDYQQLGLGGAEIVYDSGINRCFVSAWNTSHYDTALVGSVRNFYRIVPNPLSVEAVIPFGSTFGIDAFAILATPACGITTMKNVGGTIYALGWSAKDQTAYFLHFLASAVGTNAKRIAGDYGYQSLAYASIGGTNDTVFMTAPGGNQVISWDFTALSGNSSAVDATRGYVAIEYAPIPVDALFVTREFQFIDIYDTALNYVSTIDTTFTNFNGVNIQRNSVDGLLYIPGGAYKDPVTQTNVVLVLNPQTHVITVKTGFDNPWKCVFTLTKKFAVQQGSVGLKEIV